MKKPDPKKKEALLVSWYTRIVDRLERSWITTHPSSHKLYKLFTAGVLGLVSDFRDFLLVWSRVQAGESLLKLSARELRLLRTVPGDMARATPAIVVAMIPASLMILPLFYAAPRVLLTRHFWSSDQRREFDLIEVKHKVGAYPFVLHLVEKEALFEYSLHARHSDTRHLLHYLQQLSDYDRNIPLPHLETRKISTFFKDSGFLSVDQISSMNFRRLCRSNSISPISPFRGYPRYRLQRRAELLRAEDAALIRKDDGSTEDALSKLSTEERKLACLDRGLSPYGMSSDQMEKYLRCWCAASAHVPEDSQSLLLYLSPLLSYAQPTNLLHIRRPFRSAQDM